MSHSKEWSTLLYFYADILVHVSFPFELAQRRPEKIKFFPSVPHAVECTQLFFEHLLCVGIIGDTGIQGHQEPSEWHWLVKTLREGEVTLSHRLSDINFRDNTSQGFTAGRRKTGSPF